MVEITVAGKLPESWMDSDEHVVEEVKNMRREQRKELAIKLTTWAGCAAYLLLFWYGVARAI